MKPTLIYAITDGSNGEVRYVGKTVSCEFRFSKHRREKNDSYRGRWIRSIGKNIKFIELEWVMPGGDWIEAEKRWIAHYKSIGARLTNVTDGGEGCYNPTPEHRAKLSQAQKGNQRAKGYKHTPEALQKIADANRGKKKALGHRHDEATLKKISDASKGKVNSPETIEKMRLTHLAMSDKKSADMKRVWAERRAAKAAKGDKS